MSSNKPLIPSGISHDNIPSDLPLSDRLKHHRKELNSVAFRSGLHGVREYKQKFPEATPIRVHISAIAYSSKPKGYDDYIINLAESWIIDAAARTQTNLADVSRLNDHFCTDKFNPANHFSKPLSASVLRKVDAAFLKHGLRLDTVRDNTLSKIKAATRAAKDIQFSGHTFGHVGTISGNTLIIGGQSFTIGHNGNRECIRPRLNGVKRRVYLDELQWMMTLLEEAVVPMNDPLSTITLCNIGERDYIPENAEIDPLVADKKGERAYSPISSDPLLMGERDYTTETLTLAERIAALATKRDTHEWDAGTPTNDIDPLASAPID